MPSGGGLGSLDGAERPFPAGQAARAGSVKAVRGPRRAAACFQITQCGQCNYPHQNVAVALKPLVHNRNQDSCFPWISENSGSVQWKNLWRFGNVTWLFEDPLSA